MGARRLVADQIADSAAPFAGRVDDAIALDWGFLYAPKFRRANAKRARGAIPAAMPEELASVPFATEDPAATRIMTTA